MELSIGHKYICRAVKILSYGAIMEFADGSTELLHVSNISDKFVQNVQDFIQVGSEYEVTAIHGTRRSIEITLKDTEDITDEYVDSLSFAELLDMFPPTDQDLYFKQDHRLNTKRR